MMKIQDLPKSERPREKAIAQGVDSLNNRELLALLIRTGCEGMSALDVADALLNKFNSIDGILHASVEQLCQIKGISKSKALIFASLGILSKRAAHDISFKFTGCVDLFQIYRNKLADSMKEEVYLLTFNRRKYLIGEHKLRVGGEESSSISIGEILSEVLRDGSRVFILLHNHPSGMPLPSKEDYEFTVELGKEAKKLGIRLIDHMVIGEDGFYSFHEEHLLSA